MPGLTETPNQYMMLQRGGGAVFVLFCPQSAIAITNVMASTYPADFRTGKKIVW